MWSWIECWINQKEKLLNISGASSALVALGPVLKTHRLKTLDPENQTLGSKLLKRETHFWISGRRSFGPSESAALHPITSNAAEELRVSGPSAALWTAFHPVSLPHPFVDSSLTSTVFPLLILPQFFSLWSSNVLKLFSCLFAMCIWLTSWSPEVLYPWESLSSHFLATAWCLTLQIRV
jgi:hypothetical protein